MKIAIIGAGNVGGALAKSLGRKGHSIHLGVRHPDDAGAKALAAGIGANASLHLPAAAAAAAEVIILATPWPATEQAVKGLGDLHGKILVDCTNPLKSDLSGLTCGFDSSGGESVQSWAAGARVVKSFNSTGFNIMENPLLEGRKAVMFYCGDDASAKGAVRALIQDVGFEPMDCGPLASARLLEPMAMLWIASAYRYGMGRDFAFGILRTMK